MPLYFNNEHIQGLIRRYKITEDPMIGRQLREEILAAVKNIVNGIIFTHRFTAFEPYDDLAQEAMVACIVALERFDPEKGTAFNYFSLVAKKALTYYTLKNRKNRNNKPIEDFEFYLHHQESLTDLDIEILIEQLKVYFVDSKFKKIRGLNDQLKKYLTQKRKFNKRDWFRYAKSMGYSQNLIRKYLKIINENKEELYKLYEH